MSRKITILALLVAVAALAVAGGLAYRLSAFAERPLHLEERQTLEVPPGSNLTRIAAELERRGIVDSALDLRLLHRWKGQGRAIHAGEYALEPGMTPLDLLDRLGAGEVIQHALTIIEGWTFRQLTGALWRHPRIEPTLKGLSDEAIMARLGHPGEHPEGRFYPDTYHFPAGTSDLEFLRRAYDAMARRLAEEWRNRAPGLPLKTPYEALILASIIEKETGRPEERAEIAGVFIRRLQKGMRLQTDPTVIYGLGEAFDGNLRRRDLRRDTPYNTYTRKGLPPTPIAMPGGESIHAALHPRPGKSLYFVARGDGSHHFSETLEEHNRAVRKYQLKK